MPSLQISSKGVTCVRFPGGRPVALHDLEVSQLSLRWTSKSETSGDKPRFEIHPLKLS